MKVFILGNIASGKSRMLHDLKRLVGKSNSVFQIDDFRTKFSDASFDGEEYARQHFIRSIKSFPKQPESIAWIELTGFGKLGMELLTEMKADHDKKLVIFLSVTIDLLLKRIDETESTKALTPFPGGVKSLRDNASSIDTIIQNSSFMQAWLGLSNCTFIGVNNNSEEVYHDNLTFIRNLIYFNK